MIDPSSQMTQEFRILPKQVPELQSSKMKKILRYPCEGFEADFLIARPKIIGRGDIHLGFLFIEVGFFIPREQLFERSMNVFF